MLLHVYTVESAILLLNTMFFFFKKMHFILVPLYSVLIGDTILRLLLETGLPFCVVI